MCHSTDYNTSLFSLIAKFYDLSDLRRVRTAWLRLLHSGTNDGWLSPFTVCCFGTNSTCISLTASHREHHIATNRDQHSFMVIKMAYTFCFNNSLQLFYSKCSLWNIVCKNDGYKIPEVLFISLTLNWHFRKKKINQYVPHILYGKWIVFIAEL